jgi:hypothetical protein
MKKISILILNHVLKEHWTSKLDSPYSVRPISASTCILVMLTSLGDSSTGNVFWG